MAKIGLSKPYFAVYNVNDGVVSYSGGGLIGKAVQADININAATNNNFYADNAITETDRQFADGTITLQTDDLTGSVTAAILGLHEESIGTITGITDQNVKMQRFDNRQQTPYLGVGVIIKHKRNGVLAWRAIILRKVMFDVPNDSTTTQGETISWQTPSVTGTIMRDGSAHEGWKDEATFTTEAQAEIWIKYMLNIDQPQQEEEET